MFHVKPNCENCAKLTPDSEEKECAVIKFSDMRADMESWAVDCAAIAIKNHSTARDIAAYIKKEFDKKYEPNWHCIAGHSFGR